MFQKQLTSVIKAAAPFAVVLVITAFPFKEVTLKNLLQEIFVLAIYFLLIISYLLRIVLPFVGIFAIYSLLKRRVNKQLTVKDFEQALNDQADYIAILDAEIVI